MSAPQDSTSPLPGLTVLDIFNEIFLGRLALGRYSLMRPLPTEDDLAAEFGVPLEDVRTAVQAFEDDGVLCTLPGHGRFIARHPAHRETQGEAMARLEMILELRVRTGVYPVLSWFPGQTHICKEFGVTGHIALDVLGRLAGRDVIRIAPRGRNLRYIPDPDNPTAAPEPRAAAGKRGVEEEVRTGIENGTYPPGSPIPRRKALATAHGVTEKDVSAVLAKLAAAGIIEPHGTAYLAVAPQERPSPDDSPEQETGP